MVRGILLATALISTIAPYGAALAQPPRPSLVGATPVLEVTTPAGFIDDPVTVDGDRLAYVVADLASKAELRVMSLSTRQEQAIDLAPVTLHPIGLRLFGPRAFVIGRLEDGRQLAAMVELAAKGKQPAGAIVYKVAPADHVTLIVRDGTPRIAVHRQSQVGSATRHVVELLAVETGRRIAAGRALDLAGDREAKLDLRVNHWSDGYTRAHGIKGGEWDRKENQRSPDTEATYDLVTGKLERKKIEDLFEQRKRFQILAEAGGGVLDFVRADRPSGTLQLWRGGVMQPLALDQLLASYDATSLQADLGSELWLALKVDPVNAEAVARKKADPEYLDVFVGTGGTATRKARILAKGVRHRFGVAGGKRFWLLERNSSMERGGKRLAVYELQ
jgi:hypothetical protein